MGTANHTNEYALALGEIFDECPKAVVAAIAVSVLTCGGDHLDEAQHRFADEWRSLHQAGIVPQKLGRSAREALANTPEGERA